MGTILNTNAQSVGRYSTVQIAWKIIRTNNMRWNLCDPGKYASIGEEVVALRETHVGLAMWVSKIRLDQTKQPQK